MNNSIENLLALIDIRRDDFLIKWRLSDLCNYKCSYCIRNRRGGDKRKPYTNEDLKSIEDRLCWVSVKLYNTLKTLSFRKITVSVIGGEPSIFDIKRIFTDLVDVISKVVITTNLSQPVDYYTDLYDYFGNHNTKLSLCASFHPDFTTQEIFFDKVAQIISKNNNIDSFSCEMVSNIFNQEKVELFRKECQKLDVDYKIEKDLINTQYSDYIIQESHFTHRAKDKIYASYGENGIVFSKEPIGGAIDVSEQRYLVIYDDDSYELFGTRNEFLTKVCKDNNNLMPTGGIYYCTNTHNFINIQEDKIIGRRGADTTCHEVINIEDFRLMSMKECLCNIKCTNCSLCGSMSIAKDLGYLKFDHNF